MKVGEANPTKEELEAIEKRKRIAIIKSELKELGFRGKINLEPSKVDFENSALTANTLTMNGSMK